MSHRTPPTSESQTEATLDHLGVLSLKGEDAQSFLQGYVTCDMDVLAPGRALCGAFCNLKGRVIADFLILSASANETTEYCLVLHNSMIQGVLNHMQKYLTFSRSHLLDRSSDWELYGNLAASPAPIHWPARVTWTHTGTSQDCSVDMGSMQLRLRRTGSTAGELNEAGSAGSRAPRSSANSWIYHEILSDIPHIVADTSERYLPQALGLDRLGAVSFSKSCYLGQEIIARTQHLGKLKRHLERLNWHSDVIACPQPGDVIRTAEGSALGDVIWAAMSPGAELPAQSEALDGKLLAVLKQPLEDTAFVNDIALQPE